MERLHTVHPVVDIVMKNIDVPWKRLYFDKNIRYSLESVYNTPRLMYVLHKCLGINSATYHLTNALFGSIWLGPLHFGHGDQDYLCPMNTTLLQ